MILLGLVLLLLFMSTTLRWVYFIITLYGQLVDKPKIADLLIAEFPFYFWLTIFTILVAWYDRLIQLIELIKDIILIRLSISLVGGSSCIIGLCRRRASSSRKLVGVCLRLTFSFTPSFLLSSSPLLSLVAPLAASPPYAQANQALMMEVGRGFFLINVLH